MKIYLRKTYLGYYICCDALRNPFVTIRPYENYSDAMLVAREFASTWATGQRTFRVVDGF